MSVKVTFAQKYDSSIESCIMWKHVHSCSTISENRATIRIQAISFTVIGEHFLAGLVLISGHFYTEEFLSHNKNGGIFCKWTHTFYYSRSLRIHLLHAEIHGWFRDIVTTQNILISLCYPVFSIALQCSIVALRTIQLILLLVYWRNDNIDGLQSQGYSMTASTICSSQN